MSVAALYDIHGNLLALEAVLAEIDALGIETIVIGGDIAYGGLVRETLDRLLALEERAVWVRGNTDRELVACFDQDPSVADMVEYMQKAGVWEAQQITQVHRDFLAALPLSQVLPIEGLGDVLFCRASPRNDEEMFTAITPEERLQAMLVEVTQSVVVCGHTHVQFNRQCGSVRVVNAGSLGMSYDGQDAYWILLGPTIEFRQTPYDHFEAEKRFRASGHPLTEQLVEVLLNPPSAEEATAYFEKIAAERRKRLEGTKQMGRDRRPLPVPVRRMGERAPGEERIGDALSRN